MKQQEDNCTFHTNIPKSIRLCGCRVEWNVWFVESLSSVGGRRRERESNREKTQKYPLPRWNKDEASFLRTAYYKLFRYVQSFMQHRRPILQCSANFSLISCQRNGIFCFTFCSQMIFLPSFEFVYLHDRWPRWVQTSTVDSRWLSNSSKSQQSQIHTHTQTLYSWKDISLLNDLQDFETSKLLLFKCLRNVSFL